MQNCATVKHRSVIYCSTHRYFNIATETTTQPLKTWEEIPGPPSLPIIGEIHHFLPGGSLYKLEGYNLQNHLYKTYGPIVKMKGHFGGPDVVMLFDAESSAQILRAENNSPKRPGFMSLEYYRKVVKRKKGHSDKYTGLITDHGQEWRELRSAINPIMLQPKSIKAYNEALDEVAQDMVARMKSLRNENNMIKTKFSEEINLWSLESIGLIALGVRLNSFDFNLPMDSPVRKLIKMVHEFFAVADILDFKPSIWRFYPTKTFKRAMKLYDELENLNAEFIKKTVMRLKTENKPDDEKSVLEKLIDVDEKVAVLIASDLLFAGVDTVANTMIFIFYLLAINPDKQNKLREEVMNKPDRRPYIKACIKEAMRLMPVAFGNLRETSREYNLLGYRIPKNVFVIICHQHMALMECHYPRPHEYIPERWLVDKDDPLYYGNAHPFAFSIFGYGARGCIGRRLAELEMEVFLARVIENFQIQWLGEPIKVRQSVVNYVVEPFNFIFKDV
ncbi:unnamed protein product [Parnassius mnemosyne]|uniref:Cytochrome P450 CYP12A2-like n=1 Tax=Parnassius mnemosyne TaxID=213953 RepID=A0AAV1K542_9NEOP